MPAARSAPYRLVILLVLTSVAMIAADHHDPATFTPARTTALATTEPVRTGLQRLVVPAVGAWEGARRYDDWNEENQRLRARLAVLESERGANQDASAELERLLDAAGIDHVGSAEAVIARVAVNRLSSQERIIELDRGSTDGIRNGMPVVTGSGLVGRVELAGPDRSVIRPLTAADAQLGVRAATDYGVAAGAGPDHPLTLVMDPRLGSVPPPGTRLVTSGLDRSLYPDNIPVGLVDRSDGGDPVVVPFVELDRLGYVSVLLWDGP